jgi:diketogulonate reductase-like aldo/keto reductase
MLDIGHSFKLLDGTHIPWLAWGSGSGRAVHTALESGISALQAGFRHIDTAQYYKTEVEAKEAIEKALIPRNEVYITSKCAFVTLSILLK